MAAFQQLCYCIMLFMMKSAVKTIVVNLWVVTKAHSINATTKKQSGGADSTREITEW